ncbi:hypothetical protein BaRGS_00023452 [Batillaria attramentaria]|uniref:Carbohydrate sulfotransferase n=1 Tax=Batillaria attramentaria TaxID=370345 RepID=A0ABD0KE15_9CAEN
MGRRTKRTAVVLIGALLLLFCLVELVLFSSGRGTDCSEVSRNEKSFPTHSPSYNGFHERAHLNRCPDALGKNVSRDAIYARRRLRSDDVCFQSSRDQVYRMAEHDFTKTAFCIVPKVGCTYWLTLFRWLHNDTLGKHYTNPFDMPRYQVHYKPNIMKYHRFNMTSAPSFLSDRFRFMFVREPYARLWSAYVDKFILPDYWNVDGWKIAKRRQGATKSQWRCGNDVTFVEFLDFVTNTPVSKMNDHYMPYQQLCSPCLFRPHVIGKMETFRQDTRYILKQMNLSWLSQELSDSDTHSRHEMHMLIDDAYHEIRYKFFHNCTNTTHIASRLWTVFQINGYLPKSVRFPWAGRGHVDSRALKKLVIETYENRQPKNKFLYAAQKEQAMVDAYSAVPDSVMQKLRELYELDFKMFDYDPMLEILYRKRNVG